MIRPCRDRNSVRLVLALTLILTVGTVAGCGSSDDGDDGTATTSAAGTPSTASSTGGASTGSATVEATTVATLEQPIMLLSREGDSHLWVAERPGRIRRLAVADDGTLSPAGGPVLDITSQTTMDMERGLLGMAFSPDGSTLYVSSTDLDGNSRVAAYALEDGSDDDTVTAGSPEVLLTQQQPFANHNGGHLLTDQDGQLWFGLGDGGAGDDPDNNAQDPETRLGKLLRVDLSGGGDHEIVASGLRNPWRFDIDADRQVMWIADVGQNAIEEVNRTPLDDLEGANFGWSGYEGLEPYLDGDGRRPQNPTMPVFTYRHDDEPGGCSVTGGVVWRDPAAGELAGAYLVADYCAGWVQALVADEDGEVEVVDLDIEVPQPISFGTDAQGRAYVLSGEGSVVRLDPS